MCSVSAVHDYMRTQVPAGTWTRPQFDEYKEIIRRLDALDTKLGQPECDNEDKTKWMLEVEKRLDEMERAA